MDTGWITIPGQVPSKSNCYEIITINRHATLGKADKLKKYEEKFRWSCPWRGKNISKAFEIHVRVFYPSRRSDLDNAMKILLDCLQTVKAIRNDNLCEKIVAEKFIDADNPRVELRILTQD